MEMMALDFVTMVSAFAWTGIGTATGAAFISSVAALILSIVALVNVFKHKSNGGHNGNGKDGT